MWQLLFWNILQNIKHITWNFQSRKGQTINLTKLFHFSYFLHQLTWTFLQNSFIQFKLGKKKNSSCPPSNINTNYIPFLLSLTLLKSLIFYYCKDGYLDLITQAMPSASPSEISTHPTFGSGIGKKRSLELCLDCFEKKQNFQFLALVFNQV